MNDARSRIVDRMAREIHAYLVEQKAPLPSPKADRTIMEAVSRFERGELSYPELEAAGVEFVEAILVSVPVSVHPGNLHEEPVSEAAG